jgi:PHD/YefM family antitoxin component YafN of YafNO toxin-antitoxin module
VKSASATEIRNDFGAFLDRSRSEPRAIQRTGRPVRVLLSWQEHERLIALEDAYWGQQAAAAEKESYVGSEAAMVSLRAKMNETA